MVLAAKLRSKKKIIIAVVAVGLLAGLTYALLMSHSVLSGNTISTTNADLLVSSDGTNYSPTIPGFNFSGLVPGGYPSPVDGYPIYLKNTGSTTLDLSLAVDSQPSNPDSADLTQLNFGLTDVSGQTAARGFVLQSLIDGSQPIEGELAPGATRQYKLQATANASAKMGATVGGINLVFNGTARDPNNPNL